MPNALWIECVEKDCNAPQSGGRKNGQWRRYCEKHKAERLAALERRRATRTVRGALSGLAASPESPRFSADSARIGLFHDVQPQTVEHRRCRHPPALPRSPTPRFRRLPRQPRHDRLRPDPLKARLGRSPRTTPYPLRQPSLLQRLQRPPRRRRRHPSPTVRTELPRRRPPPMHPAERPQPAQHRRPMSPTLLCRPRHRTITSLQRPFYASAHTRAREGTHAHPEASRGAPNRPRPNPVAS